MQRVEICSCNHPGGKSPKGVHLDQGAEQGHGACMFKGCPCRMFTWSRFEEEEEEEEEVPA